MCGFAGYVNLNSEPASERIVRRMADIIAHRGPDDEGVFVDGPLALGHRRLSIVDLSPAGHQPMQTPDGRFTLVYNGELYNYLGLRLELEAAGWRFRSQCDTEVLLYALVQWGKDVLPRLNGMFAFALYDRVEQTLLLARDRYGIKPLYVLRQKDRILFASEAKAFLEHPDVSFEMDLEGLVEYFTFQNFFTDRTLFHGVKLMPPAQSLEIRLNGSANPKAERYWDYHFQSDAPPLREEEYLEELERLFRQAVNRQLIGDRPVASYLSGGMDSGAITAIASPQISNMLTFTVGYDKHSMSGLEEPLDERERAEHMSYLFGTRHYEMVLKAGDMERCLARLVWHLEEPRVGQSHPNFFAAHLASRFSKVVLAGTGGDELFGGYPWRYYHAVQNQDFEDYVDKYYAYWQRLLSNTLLRDAFAGIRDHVEHIWTRDIFRDVFQEHAKRLTNPEDYVNHSLYLESKTFLHGLLVVEDKLSMAHGLETRVPFLDNDLVDFAMRLPVGHKLADLSKMVELDENEPAFQKRLTKSRDGKVLLRKMVRRHVPSEIAQGIKMGFSAPDGAWFRGESIDFVRDTLLDRSSPIYGWMDFDAVRPLIEDHLAGRRNRRLLLWSLLYVDQMSRLFFKKGRHASPSSVF